MIRDATSDDAGRIAEIQVKTWRYAYRGLIPDDILAKLDVVRRKEVWERAAAEPASAASLLVSCEAERVTGFCHVAAARDADLADAAEITSIYVEPSRWRNGHGRNLCAAALARARDRGCGPVVLWVLKGNLPARGFYEALGFFPDGAEKADAWQGFSLNQIRYRNEMQRSAQAGEGDHGAPGT